MFGSAILVAWTDFELYGGRVEILAKLNFFRSNVVI